MNTFSQAGIFWDLSVSLKNWQTASPTSKVGFEVRTLLVDNTVNGRF